MLGLLYGCQPFPYESEVRTISTIRPVSASTAVEASPTSVPKEKPALKLRSLKDGWQWRVNSFIGYRIAMPCRPIVEVQGIEKEGGRFIGETVVCQLTLEKIYYVAILRELVEQEYTKEGILKRMDQVALEKILYYGGALLEAEETQRAGCVSKEYRWETEFDEGLKQMQIYCISKGPQFVFL